MRIGVISDTHVKAEPVSLPPVLREVWSHVDLILHAGDVTSPAVIAALQTLAPTIVVAGNADGAPIRARWPRAQIIPIGKYRIGLTHGDFMRSLGEVRLPRRKAASSALDTAALHAYLRSQFEDVDVIVFGHTHRPHNVRDQGVLFFNPGAFQPEYGSSTGFVGLLIVEEGRVYGEVFPLHCCEFLIEDAPQRQDGGRF